MIYLNNLTPIQSTNLLTGLGLVGLGLSSWFLISGTRKAIRRLDYEWSVMSPEEQDQGDFTSIEKFKYCWKYYIPAAIALAGTSIAFIGANRVSVKGLRELATLYSATQATASALERRMEKEIGHTKTERIKGEVEKEAMEKNPASKDNTYVTRHYSDNLIYDYMSGRYFYMDQEELDRIINKLSSKVQRENYISLNEMYAEIGIPYVGLGDCLQIDVDDTDSGIIDVEFRPEFSDSNRRIVTVMTIRTTLRSSSKVKLR